MPTRRLSDAAQAELGVIPISGISASFTPTANSGWITSSNTNWLTARAGSNLTSSTSNTAKLGLNYDISSNYLFYQVLLEFSVSIPNNAIIAKASLEIQYTIPTTEPFTVKASVYNYGTFESSDFVSGAGLLPGTQLGQRYIPQNQGFGGDAVVTYTFDDIDTIRNTISSSGTYRILLSTNGMESTTATVAFGASRYTQLSISSATLRFTYAVVPVALSQAYWGIKSSIARSFSPNINTLAVQVSSNTSWATVAEATPGAPDTLFYTGASNFRLEILRSTDWKTGSVFYANTVLPFEFDTSTISANTNIIDVNFNLSWSSSSSFGLSEVILELYAFDFGTSVTDVDYRTRTWLQSATLLCSLSTSGLSGAGLKKFINNGYNLKNSINKGGMTRFVLTTSFHRTNISDINDFSHSTIFSRIFTTLEVIV